MYVYIFPFVRSLTMRQHASGGLVVVAESVEHLMKLMKDYPEITLGNLEFNTVQMYELKENVNPKVFIFPNAGCC